MSSGFKKFARGLGKAAIAVTLLFLVFSGYGYFAERSASQKAEAMCASVEVGQRAVDLRERAIRDGASESQTRWIKLDGMETLFITYIGLPPFSRHMCLVQSQNGSVVSVRLSRLD